MKLLVLSNGHGEDVIAVKIISELQKIAPEITIACLPIVGEGFAYNVIDIPIVGPVKAMPSGGFIYMSKKNLWEDIQAGLLKLTIQQYKVIKAWAKSGGQILAVGDILPLALAWLSGAEYAFVSTAKSEYYLRDEKGWLFDTKKSEKFWDSIYYPWERWLMKHFRCKTVFARDTLTANHLQKYQIPAIDVGNPMMDGIADHQLLHFDDDSLKILLLPGSRLPEALNNWRKILTAIDSIDDDLIPKIVFVAAISPFLPLVEFELLLSSSQWLLSPTSEKVSFQTRDILTFKKDEATLIICQNAFADCLHYADIAIAMAGTATEQFVGLGKPAIAFPGDGPQYNEKFAKNQARLLGISLQLLENPTQVGQKIKDLLEMPDYWQLIIENGKNRLGEAGASAKIAQNLVENLCNNDFRVNIP